MAIAGGVSADAAPAPSADGAAVCAVLALATFFAAVALGAAGDDALATSGVAGGGNGAGKVAADCLVFASSTVATFAGGEPGEVITGALVTKAWAAIEELSSFDPGRASKETTTTAPAVAPIAVATIATRAVRKKLGAGAR